MLTRITQLRALSLTPATSFLIAPAGPSSLQTELVLMLARPAQARTILGIGRSWKYHEKQTRRRNGNNRPIITHVTYLLFAHRDNRKAGSKHLSICLPRFSFWRVGAISTHLVAHADARPAPNSVLAIPIGRRPASSSRQARVRRPQGRRHSMWGAARDADGTIRFPGTTRPGSRRRLRRRPVLYRRRARCSTSRSRGRTTPRSELQIVSFSLRTPHQAGPFRSQVRYLSAKLFAGNIARCTHGADRLRHDAPDQQSRWTAGGRDGRTRHRSIGFARQRFLVPDGRRRRLARRRIAACYSHGKPRSARQLRFGRDHRK